MASGDGSSNGTDVTSIIFGEAGAAQDSKGIPTKAFALNLAFGLALFAFNITGFFLLKSSDIGRRIYQPKTYLVQDRLRVEPVPANPVRWIHRIFSLKGEELKLKCGLDGYFFIRFIRAMIIIFAPLMVIIVTILLPINYNGGRGERVFIIGGHPVPSNITGLDTLSWQNVAPNQTQRYWAHLFCALLAIGWTLYRVYREKLHFIDARQQFLLSPEHRLKASARTVLITNIPSEYQSHDALKAFYDVFVDNDDRSRLHVWVNRDYTPLKSLVIRRRGLRSALEKEELRILRLVNKRRPKGADIESVDKPPARPSSDPRPSGDADAVGLSRDDTKKSQRHGLRDISIAFEADCRDQEPVWGGELKGAAESRVTIVEDDAGNWKVAPRFRRGGGQRRSVPKTAWLRYEIARCTVQIEEMQRGMKNEHLFARRNSAFIQFDRQMSANMACALVSHHYPGKMTPRYLDVAPHEVLWPNMGITGLARFIRSLIASLLFLAMLFVWGIPATFLGFLSQLQTLSRTSSFLHWLADWPTWVISLISGPLSAILLALLVQLVVPALCRKLAVLIGAPTRSRREIITQFLYFTFLFVELVLVTSISSGVIASISTIFNNTSRVATILATDLPKAANYFFNYLIIQGLGFSGQVLFQYLRILFITLIYPWFTQTPRREAWLQTIIPHQMWGNVYPLITNLAVIGFIYSVIAPLMLVFVTITFSLLWVAYRHNYYYVQRVKVDTHGKLFCTALSQLLAGIYVLEIAMIGLFFLVRNTEDQASTVPQAIIMIVALILTFIFHLTMEAYLRPLYEFLPVSLEDSAADAERVRFSQEIPSVDGINQSSLRPSLEVPNTPTTTSEHPGDTDIAVNDYAGKTASERPKSMEKDDNNARTAATARQTLNRLRRRVSTQLERTQSQARPGERCDMSRRLEVANQLGAAIGAYPDELSDLSVQERNAELRVAYQDPMTREPMPIIWIPQDAAGVSEEMIKRAAKYGRWLQYSNAGAYLNKNNKCEITRPEPDVRTDWLLDWVL